MNENQYDYIHTTLVRNECEYGARLKPIWW